MTKAKTDKTPEDKGADAFKLLDMISEPVLMTDADLSASVGHNVPSFTFGRQKYWLLSY